MDGAVTAKLTNRTASGAAWLVAARLIGRAVDFLTLVALARLLSPADFGVVAIASTFVMLIEAIFELPLDAALVRLPKVDRPHFDTAFTLGLARGVTLTAILWMLAPLIGAFYHDPRLVDIIWILSLAPAIRGLPNPRMVLFARQIDFRRNFYIESAGKAIALATAVPVAIVTHSYWAIVVCSLAAPIAMVIVSYMIAPYRPRLSLSEWRSFHSFVGWSSAAQIVAAINWQSDRLILGRLASAFDMGRFSMASVLSSVPIQILIVPLYHPLIAAFSLLRDDRPRLIGAFLKARGLALAASIPIAVALGLLAGPIVTCSLGAHWQAAVPLLQWLALAIIPGAMVSPLVPLVMSLNRTKILFYQNLVEMTIKIPAILWGAMAYGVLGATWAKLAISFLMAAISAIYASRLLKIGIGELLIGPWRSYIAGGAMAVSIWAMRGPLAGISNQGLLFLALGAVGIAASSAYLVTHWLLWKLAGKPAGVEAIVAERLAAGVKRFGRERPRDVAEPENASTPS